MVASPLETSLIRDTPASSFPHTATKSLSKHFHPYDPHIILSAFTTFLLLSNVHMFNLCTPICFQQLRWVSPKTEQNSLLVHLFSGRFNKPFSQDPTFLLWKNSHQSNVDQRLKEDTISETWLQIHSWSPDPWSINMCRPKSNFIGKRIYTFYRKR